jgi:hypothetical protein
MGERYLPFAQPERVEEILEKRHSQCAERKRESVQEIASVLT